MSQDEASRIFNQLQEINTEVKKIPKLEMKVEMMDAKIVEMDFKVGATYNQRIENGKTEAVMGERMATLEKEYADHKRLAEKEMDHRRSLNWKLWLMIITAVVGLAVGLFKDSLF